MIPNFAFHRCDEWNQKIWLCWRKYALCKILHYSVRMCSYLILSVIWEYFQLIVFIHTLCVHEHHHRYGIHLTWCAFDSMISSFRYHFLHFVFRLLYQASKYRALSVKMSNLIKQQPEIHPRTWCVFFLWK